MKLDKLCEGIKDEVDVLLCAIRTMVKDIHTFNKEYDN